jgi:hypothetical protein
MSQYLKIEKACSRARKLDMVPTLRNQEIQE